MLKPVVVATAALALAGSSIVYAQQHFGGPGGGPNDGRMRFEHRHLPSAQDLAAYADARIAALKAGLQLTPDQAKNWPPFEQALRDRAQLRIQHMLAKQAARAQQAQQPQQGQPQSAPFERLAKKADAMEKAAAALKHVAETGAPLYQSLDDAQKHRFHVLAYLLRPHHHHMHGFGQGDGHGWRDGQGYGRGGDWRGYYGHRFGQDGRGPGARLQNLMESEDQSSEL